MDHKIRLEGFEGQNIELRSGGLFSGYKLFVDGQLARKGEKRGTMLIRRNDGTDVTATLKPRILGLDVPQLVIEGKIYNLVEPLQWYEWMWSGVPILLIFGGGALGGILGFVAFSMNAKIFRSGISVPLRFLSTAAVSFLAFLIFILIGLAIFGTGEK